LCELLDDTCRGDLAETTTHVHGLLRHFRGMVHLLCPRLGVVHTSHRIVSLGSGVDIDRAGERRIVVVGR